MARRTLSRNSGLFLILCLLGLFSLIGCKDNGANEVAQLPTNTPSPLPTMEAPHVSVNLPETEIELLPGEQLAIQASASGPGSITYEWTMVGVGTLSEVRDGAAIIYTAPQTITSGQNTAAITVEVANQGGTATSGITILIVEVTPTETPTETPTPAPDPTPPPTPTPVPECIPYGRPLVQTAEFDVEVGVTFPENCAEVTYINILTGTTSELPEGVDIWVFLYPQSRRYYPQSDNAADGVPIIPVQGQWSVTVYAGTPESGAEQFDIVVMLATAEASDSLSRILQEWADNESYPGLSQTELPEGLMEVQTITIIRGE